MNHIAKLGNIELWSYLLSDLNDFLVEVFVVKSKLKKFYNWPLKNDILNALSLLIVKADGWSKSRISLVKI